MSPPLGLHLAAMRFAMREAVLAADLLLLRVWCAYLMVRGWASAWARSPAGYRTLRAECGGAPGVQVVLYEREAHAVLDAAGIDPPTRYARGVMRLATAEGRPAAEVLGDLLALQAWWLSRADDPGGAMCAEVTLVQRDGRAKTGPWMKKGTSLDEFLAVHPRLLEVLTRLAHELIATHGARVSVNALFEKLRADLDLYREVCGGTLPPKTRHGIWRLDNSHRAAVGRLLAASDPLLARHLDLRRSRADTDPWVANRSSREAAPGAIIAKPTTGPRDLDAARSDTTRRNHPDPTSTPRRPT